MSKDKEKYNVMFLDNEGQLWFSEEYCNFQLNELQQKINKAIDLLNKEWFTYNQTEVEKFINELKEVLGEK